MRKYCHEQWSQQGPNLRPPRCKHRTSRVRIVRRALGASPSPIDVCSKVEGSDDLCSSTTNRQSDTAPACPPTTRPCKACASCRTGMCGERRESMLVCSRGRAVRCGSPPTNCRASVPALWRRHRPPNTFVRKERGTLRPTQGASPGARETVRELGLDDTMPAVTDGENG